MSNAVTFADALVALRVECGEPTHHATAGASWLVRPFRADGVGLLDTGRAIIVGVTSDGHGEWWTVAGEPSHGRPLTPLADAVRDAGAWLRGRG